MVFLLCLITCGLFQVYWYYRMYRDLSELAGRTPTGNSYALDFILVVITLGIWSVVVDYQISVQMNDLQQRAGLAANDTTTIVIVLDVLIYFTAWITNLVTTAIHQDQLNRILQAPGAANLALPPGQ